MKFDKIKYVFLELFIEDILSNIKMDSKYKCFQILNFLLILLFSLNSFYSVCAEDLKSHAISNSSSEEVTFIEDNVNETCKPENYFWVIYDNVCPYCRESTKHIKSLDWEGRFKFLSYRNPLTYKMFPRLSREECEKDVHMVTPTGEVLSGYKVFRTIIDNLTATKILNPLLRNDYAEKKLNEIYEKMVKERSCYYNKSGTCSVNSHNNKK
jgi:predicted DCC family thiol-disulfide oxidoreductase YuxK